MEHVTEDGEKNQHSRWTAGRYWRRGSLAVVGNTLTVREMKARHGLELARFTLLHNFNFTSIIFVSV